MAIIINSSFHPARDYLVLLTHCYYRLLLPTYYIADVDRGAPVARRLAVVCVVVVVVVVE